MPDGRGHRGRRLRRGGALAGVDLRFRLFGANVSLHIVVSIPLACDNRSGAFGVARTPAMGGLRFRF